MLHPIFSQGNKKPKLLPPYSCRQDQRDYPLPTSIETGNRIHWSRERTSDVACHLCSAGTRTGTGTWDHYPALAYSLSIPWPAVWGGLVFLLLAKITPNPICGRPETRVVLIHVTMGAWHGFAGREVDTKEALATQVRSQSGSCKCVLAAPNPGIKQPCMRRSILMDANSQQAHLASFKCLGTEEVWDLVGQNALALEQHRYQHGPEHYSLCC